MNFIMDHSIWCSSQLEEPISVLQCCKDEDFCNYYMTPELPDQGMLIRRARVLINGVSVLFRLMIESYGFKIIHTLCLSYFMESSKNRIEATH